jgi:2-methylcitrate dehydratase PrpD
MNTDKQLPENEQVTRLLARHIAHARFADLPEAAVAAGRRGVLDWLGCALAGSRHATLDILAAVMQELNGQPQATVLGRRSKAGLLEAATINGQMGHVLDYDDTHMGGVVLHASSPVLAALLALSETRTVSGSEVLLAYACGFEAGVRVGQASPGHHRGGWHLTGTLGTFAASAAAARLLGLDEQQTVHALGIAGTQAGGMQQNRGTMCKSFHAGKAASNGILAAKLAQRGFDSSAQIVEGNRGFCRIYSDVAAPQALVDELGKRWEITRNGHKPYACGVVLHPAIDALIRLRKAHAIDPATVTQIALRVHPLVLAITAVVEPRTGLKSKFSISHCAAVALHDGAAGTAQYTDEKALDPAITALRLKTAAVADESLRNDEAHATVVADGKTYEFHVDHATGTVDNPMDDAAIQEKFLANAEPVIGSQRARQVCDWVWSLERQADVRELLALCA